MSKIQRCWKDIVGYENIYSVSNNGEVKSLQRKSIYRNRKVNEKILKAGINKNGYKFVFLYKDGKKQVYSVHRLVLCSFKNKPLNHKFQVNHISGIKTDNFLDNLEFVTCSENILHAYRLNLKLPPNEKKTIMTDINNTVQKTFKSLMEAMRWLRNNGYPKASVGNIGDCCQGRRKTAYGYKWIKEENFNV